MLRIGDRVRYVRMPDFNGKVTRIHRNVAVLGELVTLYHVRWDRSIDGGYPMMARDEGGTARSGYLLEELERRDDGK